MDRLRVVVDAGLSPGAVAAQAVHAVVAFGVEHPEGFKAWRTGSSTIVILAADEAQLAVLRDKAARAGLDVASFHEPDLDDALTAIAVGPSGEARRLTRGLRLAVRWRARRGSNPCVSGFKIRCLNQLGDRRRT